MRLTILPVTVDAPVALLKGQQRPWDVEVDQLVREIMEVQSLRSHVRRQQDADGSLLNPEIFDDLVGLEVGADPGRVQGAYLFLVQIEIFPEAHCKPFKGPVELVEGVMIERYLPADLLDFGAVDPNERICNRASEGAWRNPFPGATQGISTTDDPSSGFAAKQPVFSDNGSPPIAN
jgi:hypothetical protein